MLLTKDAKAIEPALAEARAVALVRDLVNTPAEDMGPAALEAEAEKLAKAHGAKLSVTKGEALEREYPMVHAVGRAAARSHAPRMIHLTWGDEKAPGAGDRRQGRVLRFGRARHQAGRAACC